MMLIPRQDGVFQLESNTSDQKEMALYKRVLFEAALPEENHHV